VPSLLDFTAMKTSSGLCNTDPAEHPFAELENAK
jgi:hypothetical protein